MATYSYTGDPSSSVKDRLRFLIEDTLNALDDWLYSDEELAAQAALSGGIYSAAADICGKLALRFARDVDTSLSGVVSKAKSQRARVYLEMEKRYRLASIRAGESQGGAPAPGGSESAGAADGPFVGGVEDSRPAFRSSVPDWQAGNPYRTWPYAG